MAERTTSSGLENSPLLTRASMSAWMSGGNRTVIDHLLLPQE
jgi:hypothetical protein